MKTTRKFMAIVMVFAMILSMGVLGAFAQTQGTATTGTGSITITNAAMGETYSVVQLFKASVTGTTGGSIVYTGDIPDSLSDYFTNVNGYVVATDAADFDDEVFVDALVTWAKDQTAVSAKSDDGTPLTFAGLEYGYYVVLSTQGAAVTVTSTNPNATITDKNTTTPSNLSKTVKDANVNIGDTVTYTVSFDTANYNGTKKIVSYTIEDTLPDFLEDVEVTSIKIDGTPLTDKDGKAPQFDEDNKITIDWYDDDKSNFRYENGANVEIIYTAVVTEEAAVAGNGNTNQVELTWKDDDGDVIPPNPDDYKKTATIYTYALALKKVDDKGVALAGATFEFPFYVKKSADTADGAYIYAGTADDEGLTNTITTPDDGVIIVKGLESGTQIEITETNAPDGYNKLTTTVKVTPAQNTATTTNETFYIDTEGNVSQTSSNTVVTVVSDKIAATPVVVVNKSGAELPSTGGMGTVIFVAVGSLVAVAAVCFLVTKKRMQNRGMN